MKKIMLTISGLLLTTILLSGCTVHLGVNPPNQSQFIGVEKAKEIALAKAGLPADGVLFDRVELEQDNGIWHYEVNFRKDLTEYDADIKAEDGSILSWEMDTD